MSSVGKGHASEKARKLKSKADNDDDDSKRKKAAILRRVSSFRTLGRDHVDRIVLCRVNIFDVIEISTKEKSVRIKALKSVALRWN